MIVFWTEIEEWYADLKERAAFYIDFKFRERFPGKLPEKIIFDRFLVSDQFARHFIDNGEKISKSLTEGVIDHRFIEKRILLPHWFQFFGKHILQEIYKSIENFDETEEIFKSHHKLLESHRELARFFFGTQTKMIACKEFCQSFIEILRKIYTNLSQVKQKRTDSFERYTLFLDDLCNKIYFILQKRLRMLYEKIKRCNKKVSIILSFKGIKIYSTEQLSSVYDSLVLLRKYYDEGDPRLLDRIIREINIKQLQDLYFQNYNNSHYQNLLLNILEYRILVILYAQEYNSLIVFKHFIVTGE